jgi:hypothetical protein
MPSFRVSQSFLKASAVLATAAVSFVSAGQQQPEQASDTRQLYYLATSPKDTLPDVPADAPAKRQASTAGAVHLGFRYNLLVLNAAKHYDRVPADRTLRAGDCFALEVQSNRSGYLYVLAKQSSGAWLPLLPSPEMPEENNVLDPGKKSRVPRDYCMEVRNPPGTETLFVVLSRDPRDFFELYEGIKSKAAAAGQNGASSLGAAVTHLNDRFGTRDVGIRKVEEPQNGEETRGSVYVVSTSDRPATSVVAQIQIRHR